MFSQLPSALAAEVGKTLEESERLYTEGLIYFRQGEETSRKVEGAGEEQYKKALDLFKKAADKEPPYYLAVYYLGLTYGKLGQYEEAVPQLERTLKLLEKTPTPDQGFVRPGLAAVHQDLAVAYYHVGRYEDALQQLQKAEEALALLPEAKETDPSLIHYYRGLSNYRLAKYSDALASLEEAKKSADSRLPASTLALINKLIEQTQQLQRQDKRWELRIGVGSGFDSNVTLEANSGPVFGQSTHKDDFRFTFSVDGRFDLWRTSSTYLISNYNFYQTVYTDISDFNLQAHHFHLTGGWNPHKLPDLTLGVEGGTNYFRLGGDDYLHEIYGMPFLGYFARPWAYSYLSYRFSNENYLSTPFDPQQDGLYQELNVRQYFLLGEERTFDQYLFVGYQYSMNNPSLTLGNDFQYQGNGAEAGVVVPALQRTRWETIVELSYLFSNEDYAFLNSRSSPPFSRKRDDDTHRIFFRLRKPLPFFSPAWNVEVYVSYLGTINDSNISVFKYNRHIGSLGFEVIY